MSLSVARKSVQSFLFEWRKPILIVLGFGAGIGLTAVAARFLRKRKLSRKEVVSGQKSKHALSNRILILGLDGSGKSSLLAALTHQPFSKLSLSDGFHSVMIKPRWCDKTLEFVEVPGKADSLQYWPKFTTSARLIFIVIDTENLSKLNDLIAPLESCLPEAKTMGLRVYFILNKKDKTQAGAEIETEKFLCLEGLVKDPRKEIVTVSLPRDTHPSGVNKLEHLIESHFTEL